MRIDKKETRGWFDGIPWAFPAPLGKDLSCGRGQVPREAVASEEKYALRGHRIAVVG